MKNCTFRPSIDNLGKELKDKIKEKSLAASSRSKNEFFNKLSTTGLKKDKALICEQLKTQIETEECTFVPNLSKEKSVEVLLTPRGNSRIHDKLHRSSTRDFMTLS